MSLQSIPLNEDTLAEEEHLSGAGKELDPPDDTALNLVLNLATLGGTLETVTADASEQADSKHVPETSKVLGREDQAQDLDVSDQAEDGLVVTAQAVDAEPPTEEEQNPVLGQFMSACQNGDLETVQKLISSRQVSTNDTFSQGITGLHWAAINNRITVVRYLCENDVSKADANALGGMLSASPLHWACRNGLVYVVDYLLTHANGDPALKDSQNYNALHLAVHSSNITLVVYILLKCVVIDKSIYIDEADNIKCTPLHWAAYQGDILSVNALLHYGADVTKEDKNLMTPLHWGFIRGYKSVLAALEHAGSDIFHKNDKGKDAFGVCVDMNCEETWYSVLREADRSPKTNWLKKRHYLSPKAAKITTFFVPYFSLPIALRVCDFNTGYVIPRVFAGSIIFAVPLLFLLKVIIPIYTRKEKPLFQTPFLAGLFSATAFWAIMIWLCKVLHVVVFKKPFTSLGLAISIGIFSYTFFKAMMINPGFVPVPTDPNIIFDDIKDLVSQGKLDTEHFCFNTFTRTPLRSKYSKVNHALVARFDHYCPWVYNDIGVRNHKLFITFVYSLLTAIALLSPLLLKYFEISGENAGYDSDSEGQCLFLSGEFCVGYTLHPFMFNLMVWCWFQGIWISFLCVVQTFQIFKGLTTHEFSSLNKQMSSPAFNHSTVPGDFGGPNGPQILNSGHRGHTHGGLGSCGRLLGLDQFIMTMKVAFMSLFNVTTHNETYTSIENLVIPTDFGWRQNWLDFWFIGEITWRNIFFLPIEGENNLNGEVVDYYKLFKYPEKHTGSDAV